MIEANVNGHTATMKVFLEDRNPFDLQKALNRAVDKMERDGFQHLTGMLKLDEQKT